MIYRPKYGVKAAVLGQVKPGIAVWETDKESKFSKIPYIIFPGNVGDKNTLKEILELLTKEEIYYDSKS